MDKQRRLAIALEFDDQEMDRPFVSLIGERKIARQLEHLARRYGIPVSCNSELAMRLSELSENDSLPEEFFEEVAQIFVDTKSR